MKVAYVCADPGIPVFGQKGASIHIQEVLRVLLRQGAEITLFAQRLGGEVPHEFRTLNIVTLPSLPGADEEMRARAALNANTLLAEHLAAAGPFDVVYERYSLWSHAAITYAHEAGIPSVLEVNAPLPQEQRQYRKLVLEQEAFAVLDNLLNHAAIIIAVSGGVRNWLETFAPAQGKVHVVENGVDPARFAPRADNSERDALTLGFVGTLKPWHGLHTLVDAFILLRQKGYNVTLSIIGDGPQAADLQQRLASSGVSGAQFHGAVAPEQVPQLLSCVDIAVAPYPQLENFYFSPLKIYEYMAAGLPVITTRVGHLAELVSDGETGLLVAPEDPTALAQAVISLIDNPAQRQRLGNAGRREAEQHHSWTQAVKRIWQLAGLQLPAGACNGR
ncbi:glycosyltransferase family 4 protein [Enterobacteriaceae bacterium 4M9]|nr:glycosyltransferase family 4 protein [Enterobacteriaceae bacterium 4M9]